ncbi:hypothetical protein ACFE04_015039 [Oxalis oulophora]
MTVDDDNSIYVGGLPYNATEDTLRHAFDYYGHIIAVKIINDHGTRGKCYGFVTYTNPQSAINAINDMDGRTINGRAVRVNGVTNRGGRLNSGRQNARRSVDVDNRGRNNRIREYEHDRERYEERYSDRSRERSRSHNRYGDREMGVYEHDRERDNLLNIGQDSGRSGEVNGKEYIKVGDRDWERDHHLDRYEHERDHVRDRDSLLLDRFQDKDMFEKANGNEYSKASDRNWEREHLLDGDHDRKIDVAGTNASYQKFDEDKDQFSRKINTSETNDRRSRERSSNSRDGYNDKVSTQVERSIDRGDDLITEVSQMEQSLKENQQLVLNLQRESKKLEDELVGVKKRSSRQQLMLTNLCKGFLRVQECKEKLKSSEKELQALVEMATVECDMADDAGDIKDAKLPYGSA